LTEGICRIIQNGVIKESDRQQKQGFLQEAIKEMPTVRKKGRSFNALSSVKGSRIKQYKHLCIQMLVERDDEEACVSNLSRKRETLSNFKK